MRPDMRLFFPDLISREKPGAFCAAFTCVVIELFQVACSLIISGDDQFAHVLVRNAVISAHTIQEPVAFQAEPGLERARGVIKAPVNYLAVSRGGLLAEFFIFLKYIKNPVPGSEFGRNGKADHSCPYNDNICIHGLLQY